MSFCTHMLVRFIKIIRLSIGKIHFSSIQKDAIAKYQNLVTEF